MSNAKPPDTAATIIGGALEYRERVVRLADERHDFVQGDDGYWVYWPTRESIGMGALTAVDLRILADELDRRNKPWDECIQKFFAQQEEEVSVCAHMQPRTSRIRFALRIGGPRYVCTLPYQHEGACGQWRRVSQPVHAEWARTHKRKKFS